MILKIAGIVTDLIAVVSAMALSGATTAAGDVIIGNSGQGVSELITGVIDAVIYSALCIVVLLAGFKLLDLATPFALNKEIAEDNNLAAGLVVGGILVGLGLIVAAAIL